LERLREVGFFVEPEFEESKSVENFTLEIPQDNFELLKDLDLDFLTENGPEMEPEVEPEIVLEPEFRSVSNISIDIHHLVAQESEYSGDGPEPTTTTVETTTTVLTTTTVPGRV